MPQAVSATDLVRGVFAALDAKDPVAVIDQMTDDVRMRLGNADVVEGKPRAGRHDTRGRP
jgi:ketosteroid isomerase-like protein